MVDSACCVGRYTSLDLDEMGRPRIIYYDDTNGDLKYAHASTPAEWPYTVYLPLVFGGYGP